MIRRKRPLSESSPRGFSFDLVSRRKDGAGDEARPVRSPLELLTDTAPEAPAAEAPVVAEAPAAEPFAAPAMQAAPEPVAESPLFLAEPIAPVPEPATELDALPEALVPEAPVDEAPEPVAEPVEAVEPERPARRTSRVKTTFLGFERSDGRIEDILAAGQTDAAPSTTGEVKFPVGWLAVTKGPGRGTSISLHAGVSQIGRGDDQAVQLDYGDNGISRTNHAAIAFDDEEGKFFLGHGGKANIVRLNGKPVLSTEELSNGDEIRISETTLKFIALCGEDFTWDEE